MRREEADPFVEVVLGMPCTVHDGQVAHVAAEARVVQEGARERAREGRRCVQVDLSIGCVRCVPVPVCANEARLRGVCGVEVGEYFVENVVAIPQSMQRWFG